jgi:type I restriction enzyme M protein
MAVAEKVGVDRRGNKLYKRSPQGEELTTDTEEVETITVGGRRVARTLRRKSKIADDDLPVIADRYSAFRRVHTEPGA